MKVDSKVNTSVQKRGRQGEDPITQGKKSDGERSRDWNDVSISQETLARS